jgi:hypothetical protein
MIIKLCEDKKGYKWATALSDKDEDCELGPILGPPEGLDHREVHNKLAEAGIYNAFDLLGSRSVLIGILDSLGVKRSYARVVTNLYQVEYYKEDK